MDRQPVLKPALVPSTTQAVTPNPGNEAQQALLLLGAHATTNKATRVAQLLRGVNVIAEAITIKAIIIMAARVRTTIIATTMVVQLLLQQLLGTKPLSPSLSSLVIPVMQVTVPLLAWAHLPASLLPVVL